MAVDLFNAALEVQAALVRRGWRFCFIGGLAVQQGYIHVQFEPLAELKGAPELVRRLTGIRQEND